MSLVILINKLIDTLVGLAKSSSFKAKIGYVHTNESVLNERQR
jgi:hypothetical protein